MLATDVILGHQLAGVILALSLASFFFPLLSFHLTFYYSIYVCPTPCTFQFLKVLSTKMKAVIDPLKIYNFFRSSMYSSSSKPFKTCFAPLLRIVLSSLFFEVLKDESGLAKLINVVNKLGYLL